MSNESSADSDFDFAELHGLFFDEAAEHLDAMEALLLSIDIATADDEQLNAIFRAAHSIKGGAATFGFTGVTELTHEMETVFDRVRKGHMPLSTALVDTFLASGDMLKSMLLALKTGGSGVPEAEVTGLCARLRAFLGPVAGGTGDQTSAAAPSGGPVLELVFGPLDEKFTAASVDCVVADLKDFGCVEEIKVESQGPVAERRFRIVTEVNATDLTDAIAFMADPARVKIVAAETGKTEVPATEVSPSAGSSVSPQADHNFGLFVDPEALPVNQPDPESAKKTEGSVVAVKGAAKPAVAASGDTASIRVSVEKVDQLINLVGELLITQAMLAQTASKS
ncbi:MAG: Hpt domain-containing protein, partial [Burkholderiales bacterium]|nr:Hpt domain-containing protein [Burkholderiales bacterium]